MQKLSKIDENSRSYRIFLDSLKTDSTKDKYVYWLNKWMKYKKLENHDDLLKDDPKTIQRELEDYLMKLKQYTDGIKSTSGIYLQFYALFHFYAMNDVILNEKKIKKLFPEPYKLTRKPYTSGHIRAMIKAIDVSKIKKHKKWFYKKPRAKALILLIASSGVRLGAVPELKLKHLTKIENLYCITVYADTKSEYKTFITPEATIYLDEYLQTRKNLTPESFLFELSSKGIQKLIKRLILKADIIQTFKKETRSFEGRSTMEWVKEDWLSIPIVHGFRSRWNTICKTKDNKNDSLIESMMGHTYSIKLDQNYLKPTVENLLNEYKKNIDDLTILF